MRSLRSLSPVLTSIISLLAIGQVTALPEPPEGKQWEIDPRLTDEFDYWDATKWFKPLWNYSEPVQMRAENSGVTDGKLWIKATLDSSGTARWFKTSRVQSSAQTNYPMYTECRMKTAHISAFNTYWLNNGDGNNRDEFDICENNSNPSITAQKYRPFTLLSQYFIVANGDVERNDDNFDNRGLSEGNPLRGVRWNEAYHTIGAWWMDKNTVQFYLNGEPAGRVTSTRDYSRNLNIIWDLWTIDQPWLGGLANQADLLDDTVNTMYVDWIRTYNLVDDSNGESALAEVQAKASESAIELRVTNGSPSAEMDITSSTNLREWKAIQSRVELDGYGSLVVLSEKIEKQNFFRLNKSVAPKTPLTAYEFSGPDYVTGSLNGQQAWHASSGWSVTTAKDLGLATTFSGNSTATINHPVVLSVGETYDLGITFQLEGGAYSAPSDYVYAFLCGLRKDNLVTGGGVETTSADANIQLLKDSDEYRLLNDFATILGSETIAEGELNSGDFLYFQYQLLLGEDAVSTSYRVRLSNLTDGKDTGWGTITGIDSDLYSALTGSGAFGYFRSLNPSSGNTGFTGVNVRSVTTRFP